MLSIEQALDALQAHYDASIAALRADIIAFAENGTLPAESARKDRYTYPRLLLHYDGSEPKDSQSRAFGRLGTEGTYSTTVTRPQLFREVGHAIHLGLGRLIGKREKDVLRPD